MSRETQNLPLIGTSDRHSTKDPLSPERDDEVVLAFRDNQGDFEIEIRFPEKTSIYTGVEGFCLFYHMESRHYDVMLVPGDEVAPVIEHGVFKGIRVNGQLRTGYFYQKNPSYNDFQDTQLRSVWNDCILLDSGDKTDIHCVINRLQVTRTMLSAELLWKVILTQPAPLRNHKDILSKWIDPAGSLTISTIRGDVPLTSAFYSQRAFSTPESELYVHLLVLLYLIDQNDLAKAKDAAESLIERIDEADRRTLDSIAAKAYFYLALIAEKEGKLHELCSFLNSRLRTATLRHLNESQATLIFTLLRCYLVNRQYQPAAKLVSKVRFPEGASNNDLARFLYYQGRIRALQLDYTAASGYFLQAMRKAPQEAAVGFKQNAQKWVVVIGLLQGEIPERSIFRQPIYRKSLAPYLELTHAVRMGDLAFFNKIVEKYGAQFAKDETLTLIVRLRQNVIKTAVKQISLAYSRITIKDIAKKLQLNSETETEYMVAKAIADGAIDAAITCDTKDGERYMQSQETADVYRTTEPQHHFDTRIRNCLELHNEAVKALRYPLAAEAWRDYDQQQEFAQMVEVEEEDE